MTKTIELLTLASPLFDEQMCNQKKNPSSRHNNQQQCQTSPHFSAWRARLQHKAIYSPHAYR
jgi:hypothetical protein